MFKETSNDLTIRKDANISLKIGGRHLRAGMKLQPVDVVFVRIRVWLGFILFSSLSEFVATLKLMNQGIALGTIPR